MVVPIYIIYVYLDAYFSQVCCSAVVLNNAKNHVITICPTLPEGSKLILSGTVRFIGK